MPPKYAYLLRHIDWNWRIGRLGYCRKLSRVGLVFVVRGDLETVWEPLGLGLFWRHKKAMKVMISRRDL